MVDEGQVRFFGGPPKRFGMQSEFYCVKMCDPAALSAFTKKLHENASSGTASACQTVH